MILIFTLFITIPIQIDHSGGRIGKDSKNIFINPCFFFTPKKSKTSMMARANKRPYIFIGCFVWMRIAVVMASLIIISEAILQTVDRVRILLCCIGKKNQKYKYWDGHRFPLSHSLFTQSTNSLARILCSDAPCKRCLGASVQSMNLVLG